MYEVMSLGIEDLTLFQALVTSVYVTLGKVFHLLRSRFLYLKMRLISISPSFNIIWFFYFYGHS